MFIISLIVLLIWHPLQIIIRVALIRIFISIIIYKSTSTSWFSLILILAFTGGLIIMFLYITSLTPNNPIKLNYKLIILLSPIFLITNIFSKRMNTNSKINILFNFNWISLIIILLIILIILRIIPPLLINPFNPIKTSN